MAIVLKLKKGESVERGLKRMKKILDKEGLLKTIRDQRYFEKPCVKARKKSQRARTALLREAVRQGAQEIPAHPHPQPFAPRPHGAQLKFLAESNAKEKGRASIFGCAALSLCDGPLAAALDFEGGF